jgi:fatty-acyl-CoA synthase
MESVYMPLTPMFHVHAWGIPYIATFLGIKQVYPGKYIPITLLNLLVNQKVTFSHCVPTILNMLLKDPSSAQYDLSKWTVVIGGAALPRSIAAEALRRGIDIFAGYGMSETCPVVSLSLLSDKELELPLEEQVDLRVRTGRPIGLAQVRIADQDGKDVANDDRTNGEIIMRTPYLTQGYHKDHVHSEKLWEGGWMHSNDVACVNKSGSIRITDRTKDVIKVGGEWISSLEIEDIIARIENIAEVAVIGLPDTSWGEIPLAVVVCRDPAAFDDKHIIRIVRTSVDSGVLPREVILLKVRSAESIEKTSVGKVNKVALRTKFAGG